MNKSVGWAGLFGGFQGEIWPFGGAKQYVGTVPGNPTSKKSVVTAESI